MKSEKIISTRWPSVLLKTSPRVLGCINDDLRTEHCYGEESIRKVTQGNKETASNEFSLNHVHDFTYLGRFLSDTKNNLRMMPDTTKFQRYGDIQIS